MRLALLVLVGLLATLPTRPMPSHAHHGDGWAWVVRIVDGDTMDVLTPSGSRERVRFYGFNAPERSDPGGPAATALISDLIFGCAIHYGEWCNRWPGWVWLEGDRRVVDRYGRSLYYAWVETERGWDLPDGYEGWNLLDGVMVWEGCGQAWRADGKYRPLIIALEADARTNGRSC